MPNPYAGFPLWPVIKDEYKDLRLSNRSQFKELILDTGNLVAGFGAQYTLETNTGPGELDGGDDDLDGNLGDGEGFGEAFTEAGYVLADQVYTDAVYQFLEIKGMATYPGVDKSLAGKTGSPISNPAVVFFSGNITDTGNATDFNFMAPSSVSPYHLSKSDGLNNGYDLMGGGAVFLTDYVQFFDRSWDSFPMETLELAYYLLTPEAGGWPGNDPEASYAPDDPFLWNIAPFDAEFAPNVWVKNVDFGVSKNTIFVDDNLENMYSVANPEARYAYDKYHNYHDPYLGTQMAGGIYLSALDDNGFPPGYTDPYPTYFRSVGNQGCIDNYYEVQWEAGTWFSTRQGFRPNPDRKYDVSREWAGQTMWYGRGSYQSPAALLFENYGSESFWGFIWCDTPDEVEGGTLDMAEHVAWGVKSYKSPTNPNAIRSELWVDGLRELLWESQDATFGYPYWELYEYYMDVKLFQNFGDDTQYLRDTYGINLSPNENILFMDWKNPTGYMPGYFECNGLTISDNRENVDFADVGQARIINIYDSSSGGTLVILDNPNGYIPGNPPLNTNNLGFDEYIPVRMNPDNIEQVKRYFMPQQGVDMFESGLPTVPPSGNFTYLYAEWQAMALVPTKQIVSGETCPFWQQRIQTIERTLEGVTLGSTCVADTTSAGGGADPKQPIPIPPNVRAEPMGGFKPPEQGHATPWGSLSTSKVLKIEPGTGSEATVYGTALNAYQQDGYDNRSSTQVNDVMTFWIGPDSELFTNGFCELIFEFDRSGTGFGNGTYVYRISNEGWRAYTRASDGSESPRTESVLFASGTDLSDGLIVSVRQRKVREGSFKSPTYREYLYLGFNAPTDYPEEELVGIHPPTRIRDVWDQRKLEHWANPRIWQTIIPDQTTTGSGRSAISNLNNNCRVGVKHTPQPGMSFEAVALWESGIFKDYG